MIWLPLAGSCLALALIQLPPSADLMQHVIPWMEAVRAQGATSLSGEFSVYTPPYIYVLYLGSWLVPSVGAAVAIKLLSVPFILGMAAALGATVGKVRGDQSLGWLAAALMCVTPSVLVNAFVWGQADAIYGCFLTLFLWSAVSAKPAQAAVAFGVALSFKAQAMLLSPVLLYLLLSRQMGIRHILLIPLAVIAMMIPAAIAGRSWGSLLTIYLDQSRYFGELSVNAPNPWHFVEDLHLMSYPVGVLTGLLCGAIIAVAIALAALQVPRGGTATMLVATLSATALPYVLPKMHERFFFMAEVFTIGLALVAPRYWPAALLFQVGSLIASLVLYDALPGAAGYAFVPVTLGLLFVIYAFKDDRKPIII